MRVGNRRVVVSLLLLLAMCMLMAGLVVAGGSQRFDDALMASLHADASGPLEARIWRDITALGGWPILTGITLSALGALALHRRWRDALFLGTAVAGGQLLSSGLKLWIGRSRPQFVEHGTEVFSHSFPSGHAMMTAVTFFGLAAVCTARSWSPALRRYVLALAGLVTLLVGYSRLELGVHWPSDVVGGWLLGLTWLALWRWLMGRGDGRWERSDAPE